MKLRRVVTGHDQNGKTKVLIDELCTNILSKRPAHQSCVVWSTGESPASNDGNEDGSRRTLASTDPIGSVFRVVEYAPGVAPRNHRTESIDYAVVLSGEIEMDLDTERVHLKAGDVLVQRGTIHNWINNSNAPCVIAFILIAAHPVQINAQPMTAVN